jgi:hypothetical protein
LKSRQRGWQALVSTVGVIVVAGAVAVAKWPHAWWWLTLVTAISGALIVPTVSAINGRLEQRSDTAKLVRKGFQGTIGGRGERLPTVDHANLDARVHRAVLPIPYVHRDEETRIRELLERRRPVLVVGSSMVGKTRMAITVVKDMFGTRTVLIPDSKNALASLDAADIPITDSVIWLDDVERLIGADGITDGALRRLVAAGNMIVATIRAGEYDRYRPTDQLRPTEWDVLSVFEHVFVGRELSAREQIDLDVAVNDPQIAGRIHEVGIGEYSGAAVHIAEALRLGASGAGGLGYALVLGAADWRLCGISRPVPESLLPALADPHLDTRGRDRLRDHQAYSDGLTWATRDINPKVSLLQRTGTDTLSVYDYALDLISAQIRQQ